MTPITTWTGRDATALRQAARMSVTAFAEHLGAARRTVAKWSSQGDNVIPRADMQSALDTVLTRATPEVRERFAALRATGTTPPRPGPDADTGEESHHSPDSDGDVQRRDFLRSAAVSVAELYHVVGSVLLKLGDRAMALVAAERSTRAAATSQDPVAVAASARIMTHALMSNNHDEQAVTLAADAAGALDRDTGLASTDAVAVYGALVLRGAVAAARRDDRATAHTMLDEATRAASRLGYDGNDRWTGFGATNVLLHRVNIALTLGDAGTAITIARTIPSTR